MIVFLLLLSLNANKIEDKEIIITPSVFYFENYVLRSSYKFKVLSEDYVESMVDSIIGDDL